MHLLLFNSSLVSGSVPCAFKDFVHIMAFTLKLVTLKMFNTNFSKLFDGSLANFVCLAHARTQLVLYYVYILNKHKYFVVYVECFYAL